MKIQNLRIKNFKSIYDVRLSDIPGFAVFAGANGSGKSNFFQAVEFYKDIVTTGARHAMNKYGGYEDIRPYLLPRDQAGTFLFEISVKLNGQIYNHRLELQQMDTRPVVLEKFLVDEKEIALREKEIFINNKKIDIKYSQDKSVLDMVTDESSLFIDWLGCVQSYLIDPVKAREPNDFISQEFPDHHVANLTSILNNLLKDKEKQCLILDEISAIVPGIEEINVIREKLNSRMMLTFTETGIQHQLPSRLISDGTIYALSILAIIFSAQGGTAMIEEPERGLNPMAIQEMVRIFREKSDNFQIFINTHSETFVRLAQPGDLFMVDKKEGKTLIRNVWRHYPNYDYSKIDLNRMWLSNMFGGGLPW